MNGRIIIQDNIHICSSMYSFFSFCANHMKVTELKSFVCCDIDYMRIFISIQKKEKQKSTLDYTLQLSSCLIRVFTNSMSYVILSSLRLQLSSPYNIFYFYYHIYLIRIKNYASGNLFFPINTSKCRLLFSFTFELNSLTKLFTYIQVASRELMNNRKFLT